MVPFDLYYMKYNQVSRLTFLSNSILQKTINLPLVPVVAKTYSISVHLRSQNATLHVFFRKDNLI